MEPITSAVIISAIVAGASEVTKGVVSKGISDTYDALKGILIRKFGHESELVQKIEQLERKPESKGQQMLLDEVCTEVKIDKDNEVQELVRNLMAQLKESMPSQVITQDVHGDGNIQIGNVTGNVNVPRN